MRALAEFIMRGRLQAAVVALLGNLLPLVSPAAVGLVTLRRSLSEGLLVTLWAGLPSLVAFYVSDMNPLITGISVVTLLAVLVGAETLRATVSWSLTLPVIIMGTGLGVIAAGALLSGHTSVLVDEVQELLLAQKRGEVATGVSIFHMLMAMTALNLAVEQVSGTFVLGFLAWLTGVQVVACLLLARWWQALLYNPGGFRQEFHGLHLDRTVALALGLGFAGSYLISGNYAHWGSLLGMPLLLAGLGLVHFTVAFLHKSGFWLALVYAGLVFLSPLSLLLIGIGFLDSFFNLRARLAAQRGDSGQNNLK